jgi:hypothetical protein
VQGSIPMGVGSSWSYAIWTRHLFVTSLGSFSTSACSRSLEHIGFYYAERVGSHDLRGPLDTYVFYIDQTSNSQFKCSLFSPLNCNFTPSYMAAPILILKPIQQCGLVRTDFGSNFATANLARGVSNARWYWNLVFVRLARDSQWAIGSRGPGATRILLVHVLSA